MQITTGQQALTSPMATFTVFVFQWGLSFLHTPINAQTCMYSLTIIHSLSAQCFAHISFGLPPTTHNIILEMKSTTEWKQEKTKRKKKTHSKFWWYYQLPPFWTPAHPDIGSRHWNVLATQRWQSLLEPSFRTRFLHCRATRKKKWKEAVRSVQ